MLLSSRMQNIAESESDMKTELQQSYNLITEHLRKRMEDILKETKVTSRHSDVESVSLSCFVQRADLGSV